MEHPTDDQNKSLVEATKQTTEEVVDQAKDTLSSVAETIGNNPIVAKTVPVLLKIYGVLCLVAGIAGTVIYSIITIGSFVTFVQNPAQNPISMVILIAYSVVSLVGGVMFVILGYRLLRNRAKAIAKIALSLTVIVVLTMLLEMMMLGFEPSILGHLVQLAILIAIMTHFDPALVEERSLQRKLRKMDSVAAREERQRTWELQRKTYIPLNFFNIFWIFVVCCIIGIVIETVYHFALFGDYQNRTGMLFGPFSPIYGFGALLMTIALNRFYKKNVIIIFLVSAVIGGAFEFCVSLFMELAFGVTAWDYTGTWLSIGGRTNGMYMIMWGLLGTAWIKLLLPLLLKLINRIPWNLRYSITTVCAVLMIINGVMTLSALGCWTSRVAGETPNTAYEQFYADHFDNEWMANHFQSMTINTDSNVNIA